MMSMYEWLSIIALLLVAMGGLYKILNDIKSEIQAVRNKLIDINVVDLHIDKKLLEHQLQCSRKMLQVSNNRRRVKP